MKVKVLEDKKDRMLVELEGETHTFSNVLRHVLWKNSHVKMSGYKVDHPLKSNPVLIIETDGKETPRKALKGAVDMTSKKLKMLEDAFSKVKV